MHEGVEVSAIDLGQWLGISGRSVRELAERHVLVRTKRGRYMLADSVTRYCAHLREQAAGRRGDNDDLDLVEERARLASAQADHQEMVNQLKRGELLPAAEVRAGVEAMISASRARLLALPSRVAPEVMGVDGLAQVVGVLDDAVREALDELAALEIEPTDDGNEDGGGTEGGAADLARAAKADGKRVGGRRAAAKPGGKRRARKVGDKPG